MQLYYKGWNTMNRTATCEHAADLPYIEMSANVDSLVRPNVKGTNTLYYVSAQAYALTRGPCQ